MLAMLDQELTAVWTLDIGDVDDDLPIIYRPTALDVGDVGKCARKFFAQ